MSAGVAVLRPEAASWAEGCLASGAAPTPTSRTTARSAAASGLPDFVVIGAMRAATTRLHRLLAAHPEIAMSREKETDFFIVERNFDRGIDWYRGLFPSGRRLLGETSPNYSKFDIFPGVPGRMATTLPSARLIYVVRDPIARAASHYCFVAATRRGRPDRRALLHIFTTSRYASQLQIYLEHYPPDRILVVDFDELVGAPEATLARIGGFIGAPDGWEATVRDAGEGVDNAEEELRRMPGWFFRVRQIRMVSDLRRRLPGPLTVGLRRALVTGRPRPPVTLPGDEEKWLRAELAPEVGRLRAITGLPFTGWSM